MMAEKPHLSVEEVATWLKVTPRTIYRLVRGGKLPGFKAGGQWRFSQDMLEVWRADRMTAERLKAEDQRRNG